jgi:antitoxin HicB
MRMPHIYSALFEPEPEGGFTVSFPDAGIGATYGGTWDEALAQAEDMIEEAVLGLMAHGEDVPAPTPPANTVAENGTRRFVPIQLPALTAAKLKVYHAMRKAGLNEAQLAARLGWAPKQVIHLFDGRHACRLGQIEAALAALGRRLVVSSEVA